MRWLLGAALSAFVPGPLLAPSLHAERQRKRPPALFGPKDNQPQLAHEEYMALAGVWRADFELDHGDTTVHLHLAAPEASDHDQWDLDPYPSDCAVHTVEQNLPTQDLCPSLLQGRPLVALPSHS